MDWLTTFFQNLGSTPPDAGEVLLGGALIAGAAKWLYDLVAKIYLEDIEEAVKAYLLANRYSLPVFGGIAATALGLGALLPAVLAAIPLILCLLLSWKWPAVLSQRIGRVSCEHGLLMSAVLLFTVALGLEEYSDYRVRQVTSFAIVLPPHIDNPATVVSNGFKDGVARFTYEDIYAAIGDAFREMKGVKVLPQPPADKEFDKLFRATNPPLPGDSRMARELTAYGKERRIPVEIALVNKVTAPDSTYVNHTVTLWEFDPAQGDRLNPWSGGSSRLFEFTGIQSEQATWERRRVALITAAAVAGALLGQDKNVGGSDTERNDVWSNLLREFEMLLAAADPSPVNIADVRAACSSDECVVRALADVLKLPREAPKPNPSSAALAQAQQDTLRAVLE